MPVLMLLIASLFSLLFRTDDPAPAPADDDRRLTLAELKKHIKTLMAGDPEDAAAKLAGIMADNQKYRQSQHRLTDQEYADFQAMQALGKPSEIKAQLDQIPALTQRIATIDKADKLKAIAKAAKVGNADALAGLMADREFEIVPMQQPDGSTVDHVLVIDGTTKTPIRDFVKAKMAWADAVLFSDTTPAAQGAADVIPAPGAAQGAARIVPFAQGSGATTPAQGAGINASEIAARFNEQRNAGVKNPLAS